MNDLTPQIRFNILRKDYFISENIVINETALNTKTHVNPHLLLPLIRTTGNCSLTDWFQFSLPLRAVPEDVLPVIKEANVIPLISQLTVFIRSGRSSHWLFKGGRCTVQFPIQLRQECRGTIRFVAIQHCERVGGKQSSVMKTEKDAPFVSYMGFLISEYAIRGFFDIILNEDLIPFSHPQSHLSSLLSYLDHQYYARDVVLDLVTLLQLGSAPQLLPLQIPNLVTVRIPLIRIMAETPVLRFIESCAVHFSESLQLFPNHSRNEFEEISYEMQRLGVISNDSSRFIDDLIQFERFGGKVVISSLSSNVFPIALLPSDNVFSICHEGWNRSQILLEAVRAVKRTQVLNPFLSDLEFCHGAVSGFDPREFFTELNEQNQFKYIRTSYDDSDPVNESFQTVFRHPKQHRIGSDLGHDLVLNQKEGDCSLVLENRQFLFNYFSTIFWSFESNSSRICNNGRNFFFLFYRALPIILRRLLESSCLEEGCFKNVFLIGIPIEDVISHSETDNLENVYLGCFEGYLNSLLCSQIIEFTYPLTDRKDPAYRIDSLLSPSLVWVKSGIDWYLGRVIMGTRDWRIRKWDYLRRVIDRLNLNRWPSPIRFYRHLHNVSASRVLPKECDVYLFGPVEKTDLCLVSSMEVIDALSVLKSLTEQIVYLNDTGIVLNNSFVDNACSPVFNDH